MNTNKCKKCLKDLSKWSKFKDMEMKENVVYAIVGSVVNGLGHMFWGNARYKSDGCDHWTKDLYFCKNCGSYYIRCAKCGNFIMLKMMPKNGKTQAVCSLCGDKILYAGDYDMGGA